MPTDPAVMDVLDKVAVRRSAASAFPTAVPFDVTRSPSSTSHFGNASFARVLPTASLAAAAPLSPSKSMSSYPHLFSFFLRLVIYLFIYFC